MHTIATINRRVFSIKSKKIGRKNTKLVVSNMAEALSATDREYKRYSRI